MLRFVKNVPVADTQEQVWVFAHYMRIVLGFSQVDASAAWPTADAEDTDGATLVANPTTFYTVNNHFAAPDVGKFIAMRGTTHDTCGIFQIVGFTATNEVTLSPPAAFIDDTDIVWAMFDTSPAAKPAAFEWVVFESSVSPTWQMLVTMNNGGEIEIDSHGSWDIGAGAFNKTPLTTRCLIGTTTVTGQFFGIGDDGWFFTWTEQSAAAGAMRKGLWGGAFTSMHDGSTDPYPIGIVGTAAGAHQNINIDQAAVNPILLAGLCFDTDLYTEIDLHGLSWLTNPGGVDVWVTYPDADTRSGDFDLTPIVAGCPGIDATRCVLPGLYFCGYTVANRTTLNTQNQYVVANGFAVDWDGSVPI